MKKFIRILFLINILLTGSSWSSIATAVQPSSKDFQKAEKLFSEKRYEEAIELYVAVLRSVPDLETAANIHSRVADGYFQLGDYDRALAKYRVAINGQKRSEQPMTQYWIGFCCFLTGRDNEAIAELLKIPELYPDSGMLVSTAYYWAGRASERMGKKDQAADYYRKAGGSGKSTQARYAKKRAEAVKEK